MLDRIHKTNLRRVAHIVFEKGFIEVPPKLIEYLGKILGGVSRDRHAAREGTVKMGVPADIARHDILTTCINALFVRVTLNKFRFRGDIPFDINSVSGKNFIFFSPSDQLCICN